MHIDLHPYATEIASNLALLQSRVQTETCVSFANSAPFLRLIEDPHYSTRCPSEQGQTHTVIRWIHRSCFQLRGETPLLPLKSSSSSSSSGRTQLIDPAWEGFVYIEAEGTNEGLEELQARVGHEVRLVPARNGARPPVVVPAPLQSSTSRGGGGGGKNGSGKTVFRMIRAQSRPGELWLRCAREKEKVLR